MFPHIPDSEFAEIAAAIAATFEIFPVLEPPVTTRVNALGWGRWMSDYLTARARGEPHDRAVVMTTNGIRQVVNLPTEPVPVPPRDIIMGGLRVEGAAFADDGTL